MFLKVIEVGDLHADLWERLALIGRHVDGPEDVTLGVHPVFGLCIVRHHGYGDHVEWWTQRLIDL